MNKSISSIPGAGKFRSTIVIILVSLCIFSFLFYTEKLSDQAEKIAQQRVITDIRLALSLMFYDYVIKGKQSQLVKFDHDNPFVPLAIYGSLPSNYHGVVKAVGSSKNPGWYFELTTKRAVYIDMDGKADVYSMSYVVPKPDKPGRLTLTNE